MPPQFRLSTLQKLREATRDERRQALAQAYRADETLVERLDQLDRQLIELAGEYRAATQPGRVNVDRLIDCHRQDALLRAMRQEPLRQRELLAAEIERRRQALLAADVDVRMLEKLAERYALRYEANLRRRETRLLDEFAIGQTFHGRRDESESDRWDA